MTTSPDHHDSSAPAFPPTPFPAARMRRAMVGCWLLAGAVLLMFIGSPPVQRTQEARVLVVAREMLSADWHGWLIPQLNGELRLRKPPLTYWLAAGAYKLGGVNEAAGRVPTAVLGWLTLGVTFAVGRHLFGVRAGLFAAAALMGSYFFFRHVRLAETDAPAMLFVTVAVYAILRTSEDSASTVNRALAPIQTLPYSSATEGAPAPLDYVRSESERARNVTQRKPPHAGWLHVAAVGTGLAFLSKQGPGAFALIFLLTYATVEGRWDVVRRFFTSGAVATLLVLGASWYVYASLAASSQQFAQEARVLGEGEAHNAPFYQYFPQLLLATLPWTGFVVAGTIEAARRWGRPGNRSRGVLLWAGSILAPLLIIPNRQNHYLVPLMPPLMVLAGWWIDQTLRSRSSAKSGERSPAGWLIVGTLAAAGAAGLALPWVGWKLRGTFWWTDVWLAAALLLAVAAAGICYRRRSPAVGLSVFAGGCAAAMPALVGFWFPTLRTVNVRTVAARIRAIDPDGPYCFYGPNVSVPLSFYLGGPIRSLHDRAALLELARARPGLVVIAQTKDGRSAPRLADPVRAADATPDDVLLRITPAGSFTTEDQQFDLYRAVGTSP